MEFILHQHLFPLQLDWVSIKDTSPTNFFFRIFFHIFPSFLYKIHFLFQFRWALQFLPGHRENIVCRRDGTLRHSEPSAGENLACIIPFILIYYFLIAANIWFSIFTYAWYLQTKDRGMPLIILI